MTPGDCTTDPKIDFKFSDGSREPCVLQSFNNDQIICQIPQAEGTPEIIVNICGLIQIHLPNWPADFFFHSSGVLNNNDEYCARTAADEVPGGVWDQNYMCSRDDRGNVTWTWAYNTVPAEKTCVDVTSQQDTHSAWTPAGKKKFCWPSASPYNFYWSDNGALSDPDKVCMLWSEPDDPNWNNNDHYLCGDRNMPYGQDSIQRYHYQRPTINDVTYTSASNEGGDTITVWGESFGRTGSVTIEGNPCPLTGAGYSHTYIECELPPGSGTLNALVVESGGQESLPWEFTYDRPHINQILPLTGSPTEGGYPITLSGTNFGDSGRVTVGGEECINSCPDCFYNNTAIVCLMPTGQGNNLPVFVEIGFQTSADPYPYSYSAAVVTDIDPLTAESIGGVLLAINGSSFGTIGEVFVGGRPCLLTGAGYSHTYIECELPEGEGDNVQIDVIVDGKTASIPGSFTFDPPSISGISPPGAPSGAGALLTISGFSFGTTGNVTVAGEDCPVVPGEYNHRRIVCEIPDGAGVNVPVQVFSAKYSSNTEPFTYAPTLSNVFTDNVNGASTEGSDNLFIEGLGFYDADATTSITVDGQPCDPISFLNNTHAVCELPEGDGSEAEVVLRVDTQDSLPFPFAYAPPVFTGPPTPGSGSTEGNTLIRLEGSNFGAEPTVTVDALPCTINTRGHTFVECFTPVGSGAVNDIVLTSGPNSPGQTTATSVNFKYDAPHLVSLDPPSAASGETISIIGENFFTSQGIVTISGRIRNPIFQNDTLITFEVPIGQGTVDVEVVVDGQESDNSLPFQYRGPSITGASPLTGPTAGGTTLIIEGTSFGAVGIVRVGEVQCITSDPSIAGYSDTYIECKTPKGTGTNHQIVVDSGDFSSSEGWFFNYSAPEITGVSTTSDRSTLGEYNIRIEGSNFGGPSAGGTVMVGSFECLQKGGGAGTSYADGLIICELQEGYGEDLDVIVTVDGQSNEPSPLAKFSYAAPTITQITPTSGPADGSSLLIVIGTNFGMDGAAVVTFENVQGSDLDCPQTGLGQSHTRIECDVPAGQGQNIQVRVTVGGQDSATTVRWDYHAPVVTRLTAPSGPTAGGVEVTIVGTGFGLGTGYSLFFDSVDITGTTTVHNDTYATFILPQGTGVDVAVDFTVGDQPATLEGGGAVTFDYDQPAILSVTGCVDDTGSEARGCTVTSQVITVFGANFGNSISDITSVSVGFPVPGLGAESSQACTVVALTSNSTHESFTCDLGDWSSTGGFNLYVQVNVDGQTGRSAVPLVSFRGPEIDPNTLQLDGVPDTSGVLTLSTDPPVTVYFEGRFFGNELGDVSIKFGEAGKNKVFTCTPTEVNESGVDQTSYVKCTIAAGVGLDLVFEITVGDITSAEGADTLNFLTPEILPDSLRSASQSHADGRERMTGTSTSGDLIRFDVDHVGDDPTLITVLYGSTDPREYECGGVTFGVEESTTYIQCRTQRGTGDDLQFRLYALGAVSDISQVKYSYVTPPTITRIMAVSNGCQQDGNGVSNCPTRGGSFISIIGDDFGPESLSISIGRGSNTRNCESIVFTNVTHIGCRLPAMAGTDLAVVVTVGLTFSDSYELVSYAPPAIESITGCTDQTDGSTTDCDRQGLQTITVTGTNFGPATATVLVGGRQCTGVSHTLLPTDTSAPFLTDIVECTTPEGTRLDRVVQIKQVGGEISASVPTLSYKQCEAGYRGPAGTTTCFECDEGTFTAVAGKANCQPCPPGTAATGKGATECVACDPGFHSESASASTQCLPCGEGKFSSNSGAVDCEGCPLGQYANETQSETCLLCPAGTYTDGRSTIDCEACPDGTFSAFDGANQCFECPIGFISEFQTGSIKCTACEAGTFADTQGLTVCRECDEGTFQSSEGQGECLACDSGYYGNDTRLIECAQCPPGTYSTKATGSDVGPITCQLCKEGTANPSFAQPSCPDCEAGKYSNVTGAEVCVACPKGHEAPNGRSTQCDPCEEGYFAAVTGLINCLPCQSGTYSDEPGSESCKECLPSEFQDEEAATTCQNCTEGTFSDAFAVDVCFPCASGFYANTTDNEACARCPAGTYSIQSGGEVGPLTCIDCDPGYFAAFPNQVECDPCPAGTFQDRYGQKSCKQCPAGTANDQEAQLACANCTAGEFTGSSGNFECQKCPAGSFNDGDGLTNCTLCDVGFAQGLEGKTECSICPAGKFTDLEGQPKCEECPRGYISKAGNNTCVACPAGTKEENRVCKPCVAGEFQDSDGQIECLPCDIGTFSDQPRATACTRCPAGTANNLEQQSQCKNCTKGSFSAETGQAECDLCGAGTYSSIDGAKTCTRCSPGFFVGGEGATGCTRCFRGTYAPGYGTIQCENCPSGTFASERGLEACEACITGRYQDETGKSECKVCEEGTFVDVTSATDCFPCPTGTVNPLQEQVSCVLCGNGTYQDEIEKQTCKECDLGEYNALERQSRCSKCDPGSFTDEKKQSECKQCDEGQYQPLSGQSECLPCPMGSFQEDPGQAECVFCPEGKFSNDTGFKECTRCGPGRFQNQLNSTECDLCPPGRFSDGYGASECRPCGRGEYNNEYGREDCDGCPLGTASNRIERTVCDDCGPGTFTGVTGQTECQPCSAGNYTNEERATSCSECEIGTFQNAVGNTTCLPCPDGEVNTVTGQTECVPCGPGTYYVNATYCAQCPAGKYQDRERQTECLPCPNGTAQAVPGQVQCSLCDPGHYQNGTGAIDCVECEQGRFQSARGSDTCEECGPGESSFAATAQTSCSVCSPGSYSDEYGAGSCTLCTEGSYQPEANAQSCLLCPNGTYSDEEGLVTCKHCPLGTRGIEGIEGATSCVLCDGGEFGNETGLLECFECDFGSYNGDKGQRACSECPPGRFGPSVGLEECEDCPPGTFMNESGAVEGCFPCPAGTYTEVDVTGQERCAPCPPGSFQDQLGTTFCNECDVGKAQPNTGSTECIACNNGTYSASTGLSRCRSCSPGTFTDPTFDSEEREYSCSACPVGTEQPLPAKTECNECGPGFFALNGSAACSACESGKYTSTYASSSCRVCEDLNSIPNREKSGCSCLAGYFEAPKWMRSSFTCLPCLDGAVCPFATTWDTISAAEGYWRTDHNSTTFYRCLFRRFCSGGKVGTDASTQCIEHRTGPLCALCEDGYYPGAGNQCVECPQSGISTFIWVLVIILILLLLWLQLFIVIRSGDYLVKNIVKHEAHEEDQDHFANFDEDESAGSSHVPVPGEYDPDEIEMTDISRPNTQFGAKMGAGSDGEERKVAGDRQSLREAGKSSSMASLPAGYRASGRNDLMVVEGGPRGESGDEVNDTITAPQFQEKDVFREDAFLDPDNEHIMTIHGPPAPEPNFTYKLKILVAFIQIVTNITSGVEVQWPTKYETTVQYFDVANVDFVIANATSAECIDDYDYYTKYIVILLAPVITILIVTFTYYVPRTHRLFCFSNLSNTEVARVVVKYWKMMLYILFLVYPAVSSTILRLYVCKEVGDTSYLVADMSVECHTTKWKAFTYYGVFMILLYPIGIPLFFFTLLYKNQDTLRENDTKARIGFLYAGYRHDVWWFEMVDTAHKLFLTSLLAFFPQVSQMPAGMVVAMLYTTFLLRVVPYIRVDDDRLHILAQTEIILLLLAGHVLYDKPIDAFGSREDWLFSILLLGVSVIFIVAFLWVGLRVFRRFYQRWQMQRKKGQKATDRELEDRFQKSQENANEKLQSKHKQSINRTLSGRPKNAPPLQFEEIGPVTYPDPDSPRYSDDEDDSPMSNSGAASPRFTNRQYEGNEDSLSEYSVSDNGSEQSTFKDRLRKLQMARNMDPDKEYEIGTTPGAITPGHITPRSRSGTGNTPRSQNE